MILYRLHDSEPGSGMAPVEPQEARSWNERGWGIFHPVQRFAGPVRRQSELVAVRAWAVDMDEGTKDEQRARLLEAPLMPSSIVETKNGYHAYWYADASARPEHYRAVLDRLVHFFRADRNARDLARVLRTPGYYHLKDPADPFLVRHAYGPHRNRRYSERAMFAHFPPSPDEQAKRREHARQRVDSGASSDFWERIYNLDCMDALERLSGTGYVGGERFEFRPVSGGRKHNIVVDGKGTSCWIDEDGRIGSRDNGGPTIYAWLRWYGHSPGDCARAIKELYPELAEAK